MNISLASRGSTTPVVDMPKSGDFDSAEATAVYGQTAARNLADTDPDLAITNADSHEYFAENSPALP